MILLPAVMLAMLLGSWVADPLLGREGFEERTVNQGTDYQGPVVSTVVRLLPSDDSVACKQSRGTFRGDSAVAVPRRGVLYVHGYNDYFFQDSMGMEFCDSGYAFYAVDLRRYGRSLRPGQRRYDVRNLNEYFPDIDSAIMQMHRDGVEEIALMGHSTGGLITALYMAEAPSPYIKALILNSPFLDWNFTGYYRKVLIPAAAWLGRWLPNVEISQGDNSIYGESLLKGKHGEWQFDTTLKLLHPAPVTLGWVRAINQGQKLLMKDGRKIAVPILLMHSRRSVQLEKWDDKAFSGDLVLNVDSISSRGRRLGHAGLTEATVDSGLHDLVLSRPRIRRAVYATMFRFLRKTL